MYELYYWSEIPGRGEFVRLVLEDLGLRYRDVARHDPSAVERALSTTLAPYAFAVPVLRDPAHDLVIAQTAAITRFLGERHGLAPADERGRLIALGVALTIADLVAEVHDTHHPISVEQTYEQQKGAAAHRALAFRKARLPKFLHYLEGLLGHDTTNNGPFLVGDRATYVDLTAMHVVDGLDYAFPRAMAKQRIPKLRALHDRIAARPRIATYLASKRRLPFSEMDIFRHYPELDD